MVSMKTKLGISVGLLSAAIYFSGLFSGYLVLTLLVGYTLLFETDSWLRRSAVKAFAITVLFSILTALIGFIPDVINLLDGIFRIFGGHFTISFITNLVSLCQHIFYVSEKAIMLALGLMALSETNIKIDFIDRILDKHMG